MSNSPDWFSEIYYYHSDHLGSTSWVTDGGGNPIEYISYLPYGEEYQNERFAHYEPEYSTIYGARYRFTGKEFDRETGYIYNEQRYLCTDYGFWTRVDPLVDKYLNISPYAYCNNNPLKYIDPDGMDPGTPISKSMYAKKVTALNYYQYRAQIEIDEGREAPNYLLEYGDKYCNIFMLRTSKAMSDAGKIWCTEVCASLQSAMEYAVTQDNWTDLVANPEKFLDFAYDTHVEAYLNMNGTVRFTDLPASDLVLIGFTPDMKDYVSPKN